MQTCVIYRVGKAYQAHQAYWAGTVWLTAPNFMPRPQSLARWVGSASLPGLLTPAATRLATAFAHADLEALCREGARLGMVPLRPRKSIILGSYRSQNV